jgi:5-methylcytosine-specific restriction endonuclease McrA
MQDEGYKRCSKCGETKPYSAFYRRKEGTLGLTSQCRACKCASDKRTPEERNARATAYYWANKPKRQQYVKANRHLFRAQSRRRRADPEARARINAAAREKRRGNAEYLAKARMYVARREALKREAFVEDIDPLVVLERHDGICGICGDDVDPLRFDVDHIVPLARGGEHSYRNTQPAHPSCNYRKGAKAP